MSPPSQGAREVWAVPELETGDLGTEGTGGNASMENSAGPAARTEMRHPLTKWVDDRIMAFVDLFIEIHESELYAKPAG